jgi:hypothetical protein
MVPTSIQQFKASVRINEMFFNQVRPVVHLSSNGNLASFRPWKTTMKTKNRAANWLEVQKQTETLLAEVDKCIECNPDQFVSLVGYNDDEVVDCMYLMHSPSRKYGQSCPLEMIDP